MQLAILATHNKSQLFVYFEFIIDIFLGSKLVSWISRTLLLILMLIESQTFAHKAHPSVLALGGHLHDHEIPHGDVSTFNSNCNWGLNVFESCHHCKSYGLRSLKVDGKHHNEIHSTAKQLCREALIGNAVF